VRLLSQTHHRPRLPVRARTLTKRELAGAEPTRKSSVAVMTSEAQAFTAAELERMLDW
jgi:hypothetical protein